MDDVLVGGAGPVGLLAAIELRRRGVPVRIVDAAEGPARISRALGTMGRTMEIYDELGVLDELLASGVSITKFVRHLPGREPLAHDIGYSDVPTRFSFLLLVDQTVTERVLRNRLEQLGTRVEWSTRLESLTQDADAVHVELVLPDGTRETVHTPWLVGCDGAHSVVRKQLNIPLRGDSLHTWLVVDAQVDVPETALDPGAMHWLSADGAAMLAFPLPEPARWRLTDTAWTAGGDEAPDSVAERFRARIAAATGTQPRVRIRDWIKPFTIQQRAVPTMRAGRCFVAGDAAHVHSPAGGQGMNTGLQDAFNLGWKLAAVCTGDAGPALLDTYSQERVPVGAALLDATATITEYVMHGVGTFTDQSGVDSAGREIIGRTQALAVSYSDSPLTTAGPGLPAPGERVTRVGPEQAKTPAWRDFLNRLRDPRWLLVHRGPTRSAPPWLADCPVADQVAADLGLDDGWLLVRPDGYIAARGTAGTLVPSAYPCG
ncbi:FAD-dependent monooxygenase [Amycolatopsis rhabdoformis]|uniref:FAD-dependent monooxygenase n=1 Tax=Amycolatopsis rhabdoformis TaxID=1448059 RepID=A0ABZ1HZA1_9PSEU|nr:FAD-dependent monooxygenase [Amycolatopsis rhabdoformis]WSE26897.1 FAD-dependent monooxygenase [Amycolatopsis rhabdoformis]